MRRQIFQSFLETDARARRPSDTQDAPMTLTRPLPTPIGLLTSKGTQLFVLVHKPRDLGDAYLPRVCISYMMALAAKLPAVCQLSVCLRVPCGLCLDLKLSLMCLFCR